MSITSSDLIWRKSVNISDTIAAQNGGRMSISTSIVSGVKNNLFPDASQAQRVAGATHYRKQFLHIGGTGAMLSSKVFLDKYTPGTDYALIYAGTQNDTQDALTSRAYGVAKLKSGTSITATDTEAVFTVENITAYTSATPFRAGDAVRLADKTVGGSTGNEEFLIIDEVTYNQSDITISFTTEIVNSYANTTDNVILSTLIEDADIEPYADDLDVTSDTGAMTLDNVQLINTGTIEQNWTLTFTSATAYTLTGDTVLTGGMSGTISSDFTVVSAGITYLKILSTAFSGTFAEGDSVTFSTHPSAIPIWLKRIIPAGTATLANDYISIGFIGESA
jgi:hypothetical protein